MTKKKVAKPRKFDINEQIGTIAIALLEYWTRFEGQTLLSVSRLLKLIRSLDAAKFTYNRLPALRTKEEREFLTVLRSLAPNVRIGYNVLLYMLPDEAAERYFEQHPLVRVSPSEDGLTATWAYLPHSGAYLGRLGVEGDTPNHKVGIPISEYRTLRKQRLKAKKAAA
jgi:hypothetical protein